MPITICPHCEMRVWPRPDGSCPSCNGLITQMEAPTPSRKSSAAVIKRKAKKASRKKKASKKGRSDSPAPVKTRDFEMEYRDYLQTAEEVRQGSLRVFYPYLVSAVVIAVAGIVVSFFTWQEQLVEFTKKNQPTPLTGVLFWGGILIGLGCIVLGAVKGDQWGFAQAREIAKDRTGFPEFYKAFLKRYWPKEGMATGPALKKFLGFIGAN